MQNIRICTPKSTKYSFGNVSIKYTLGFIRILYVANQMNHTVNSLTDNLYFFHFFHFRQKKSQGKSQNLPQIY